MRAKVIMGSGPVLERREAAVLHRPRHFESIRDAEIVGRDDDRSSGFGCGREERSRTASAVCVSSLASRLIGQDQVGADGDGAGDGRSLRLSAGQSLPAAWWRAHLRRIGTVPPSTGWLRRARPSRPSAAATARSRQRKAARADSGPERCRRSWSGATHPAPRAPARLRSPSQEYPGRRGDEARWTFRSRSGRSARLAAGEDGDAGIAHGLNRCFGRTEAPAQTSGDDERLSHRSTARPGCGEPGAPPRRLSGCA